jgi:hypothetical protein
VDRAVAAARLFGGSLCRREDSRIAGTDAASDAVGGEKTRIANRIHKTLEDANIKLGSVASDILGVWGRAMLDAVIAGETDEKKLADLAQRKMSGKIAELQQALRGRLTEHHRFLLRLLRKELEQQEGLIAELSQRIEELTRPFAENGNG